MSDEAKGLTIHQRMAAVMKDVAYVQKDDSVRDKSGKRLYRYVSHDDVVAKLRPSMVEHGILMVSNVVEHAQDGNRTSVLLEVDFVNVDKPEDTVTVHALGYGIDTQDKGPGKAVSYAKKYALLTAYMLETGDDPERDQIDHEPDDGGQAEPKPTAQTKGSAGLISEGQLAMIADLRSPERANVSPMDLAKVLKKSFGGAALIALTREQGAALIKRLEAKELKEMERAKS